MKDQLEALVLQMYRSNILYSEGVREFKKRFILTVLQENKGNQCRAARELGMHRNTLSRTITELKIDVRQLRDGVKRPPRSARPVSHGKENRPLTSSRSPGPIVRERKEFFTNPRQRSSAYRASRKAAGASHCLRINRTSNHLKSQQARISP